MRHARVGKDIVRVRDLPPCTSVARQLYANLRPVGIDRHHERLWRAFEISSTRAERDTIVVEIVSLKTSDIGFTSEEEKFRPAR